MSNPQERSQPITFVAFLFFAYLLLCQIAIAAPSITVSKIPASPTNRILVTGRGFKPNQAVDIYFDYEDEVLAGANSLGSFSKIAISVPASALPGIHWVSAVERSDRTVAQVTFLVRTDWNQFHRQNMMRLNPYEEVLDVNNVGSLQQKWSSDTSGGYEFASPAVANGVVYIGSNDNKVYALKAGTGNLLWSYPTGGWVYSSPAVANGVVYVGSWDHNVYALNASTGALLWTYTTGGEVISSPAVADGVVYIGSLDNSVYALNASTGAKVWSYATGGRVYSSPAVTKGVVFVGSADSNTYALSASTGALLWSYPTQPILYSSPAVANGVVYVGSVNPKRKLWALRAGTGTKLWNYPVPGGVLSSPAVANGVVYFGAEDNNVYALNARTGVKLWTYATGASIGSSPAVANGVVYIGSNDGNVYGLDASSGALLWSSPRGGGDSSPTVLNGMVYMPSGGRIFAFGLKHAEEKIKAGSTPPSLKMLHPDVSLKVSQPAATLSGAERYVNYQTGR
jgi:outer membrane protein assembly factor BamB